MAIATVLVAVVGANLAYFAATRTSPPPATERSASEKNAAAPGPAAIRFYVERYTAPCFFAAPESVGEKTVSVEAFSDSSKSFDAFGQAFEQAMGFPASLRRHLLKPPQCAAVTFARKLHGSRPPQLQIARTAVRNGDTIRGEIHPHGAPHRYLLLVSGTGSVENMSNLLQGAVAQSFSLPVPWDAPNQASPILVMAIASSAALAALGTADSSAASELFPQLAAQAAESHAAVSAAMQSVDLLR
jgi:hypothetical protein